eukprot:CAMPEP_0119136508 /NCGR_PEP_ID=MMETSP1310-20130426/21568_1 /TAXON_ID=464262 /ORGANISM="Genus nov. species nov., Strain RCC2339" /LENGTH=94 /DNA_ID=CAMNT_0007127499 /DNA_START=22 /DNA_END=303 /DNA_ORIENTATION=+
MEEVRKTSISVILPVALAAGVVVAQVCSAYVGQQLQVRLGYDKPYFITYSNMVSMMLCLPLQASVWSIGSRWRKRRQGGMEAERLRSGSWDEGG